MLNATSCANDAQIEFLVEKECVEVRIQVVVLHLSFAFLLGTPKQQSGF